MGKRIQLEYEYRPKDRVRGKRSVPERLEPAKARQVRGVRLRDEGLDGSVAGSVPEALAGIVEGSEDTRGGAVGKVTASKPGRKPKIIVPPHVEAWLTKNGLRVVPKARDRAAKGT